MPCCQSLPAPTRQHAPDIDGYDCRTSFFSGTLAALYGVEQAASSACTFAQSCGASLGSLIGRPPSQGATTLTPPKGSPYIQRHSCASVSQRLLLTSRPPCAGSAANKRPPTIPRESLGKVASIGKSCRAAALQPTAPLAFQRLGPRASALLPLPLARFAH